MDQAVENWVKETNDGLQEEWPPAIWDPVLAEVGRILFNWNTIERTTNQLLNIFIGADSKATIATAHMNSNTQIDAIRTLANEYLEGQELEVVHHLVKLFTNLRARRNEIIHAFHGVGGRVEDRIAILMSVNARGRLRRNETRVDRATMKSEARLMFAATHYFALVHNHFCYPDEERWKKLPANFPLPEPLPRNFRYVLDE